LLQKAIVFLLQAVILCFESEDSRGRYPDKIIGITLLLARTGEPLLGRLKREANAFMPVKGLPCVLALKPCLYLFDQCFPRQIAIPSIEDLYNVLDRFVVQVLCPSPRHL